MMTSSWVRFPHPDPHYQYTWATLKRAWSRLHRGDAEPWPDDGAVVDAWIAFHAGEFHAAVEAGLRAGGAGITAANKAQAIYANYLEPAPARKLALFDEVVQRAAQQQRAQPDLANAYYWQAYALGRHAQHVSVARALAQGIGGKVKAALDRTLALEPRHADAHIVLGAYHAEIIDKIGAALGALSYGASRKASVEHFEAALQANPGSAIAQLEYANGLRLLDGRKAEPRAAALIAAAVAGTPHDAMEWLDVERARAQRAAAR